MYAVYCSDNISSIDPVTPQMVANAGIAPLVPLLESTSSSRDCRLRAHTPRSATVEQLEAVSAVNIRGTFLCYKYAALQMIKQGRGGRLIGTSIYLPQSARISSKLWGFNL